jgi:hypothetical protein
VYVFAVLCRVLMQKVAKELLGMLSWPGIAARLAAAEVALGALASECVFQHLDMRRQ